MVRVGSRHAIFQWTDEAKFQWTDEAKNEEWNDGNGQEIDFCGVVGSGRSTSVVDCGLFSDVRRVWLKKCRDGVGWLL